MSFSFLNEASFAFLLKVQSWKHLWKRTSFALKAPRRFSDQIISDKNNPDWAKVRVARLF